MAKYVFTGTQNFPIIKAKMNYHDIWEIANLPGTPFYLDGRAVSPLKNIPETLPADCDEAYQLNGSENDLSLFDYLLNSWKKDDAALHRGMPGCHFRWETLRKKCILESEGPNDIPTFTMKNDQPTRWLPSAADKELATNAAVQCLDTYTKADSKIKLVPIGVGVKIHLGHRKNIPLCWLNPGETVVRGPLSHKQFSIATIVWLSRWGVEHLPVTFPMTPDQLFPARPYEPKSAKEITDWYGSLKTWFKWFDSQLKQNGFSPGLGSSCG